MAGVMPWVDHAAHAFEGVSRQVLAIFLRVTAVRQCLVSTSAFQARNRTPVR
jgi:hypothetical protein